jgi:hypothetical protein
MKKGKSKLLKVSLPLNRNNNNYWYVCQSFRQDLKQVITCDIVKWKSVVLLFSALEAKEHIGRFHVVEVEDIFRDEILTKSPEIICFFV